MLSWLKKKTFSANEKVHHITSYDNRIANKIHNVSVSSHKDADMYEGKKREGRRNISKKYYYRQFLYSVV